MGHSRTVVVHLITKLELGGAQINTVYTVEHLDPLRFDTYLLSGPGGIVKTALAGSERMVCIPTLAREIRPYRDLRALLALVRLFRRIRPQIVHTHSSKAGILGRVAAFVARVPIVIHSVHGFSFSPFQPLWQRGFYLGFEKICRQLTTHFIFVSAADIKLAQAHGLITGNYTLIRSGFPLQKFRHRVVDAAAVKRRFQLDENAFVCGVIAPFKPQKGLNHLLDIAARVVSQNANVYFLVAGDGEQRPELERELQRRDLARNFRLPGFLPDMENVIDGFDIGVSTALWEGLPQSLVQLRLKKKAVLASDIPGNREIIRDGVNGYLFPVGDHGRFAEAILKLAAEPDLRDRLGGYGEEDFTEWEAAVMVKRQEELYRRLQDRAVEKHD